MRRVRAACKQHLPLRTRVHRELSEGLSPGRSGAKEKRAGRISSFRPALRSSVFRSALRTGRRYLIRRITAIQIHAPMTATIMFPIVLEL